MSIFRRFGTGMSLVEMLIAMIILSIGLLGIARLFVRELGETRSALLRTQAISLVSDMADRIRSNAGARDAYDLALYGSAPSLHACAPSSSGSGTNCSSAQLAEDDL